MTCKYFGICGSCNNYEKPYEVALDEKALHVKEMFSQFYSGELDVVSSDKKAFRYRAEFRIWHEEDEIFYAMNKADKKSTLLIDECMIVSEAIAKLMPKLLNEIKKHYLGFKLFGADFLSTTYGEVLVSLLYHRRLDDEWSLKAKQIEDALGIKIIGRSRKQRVVLSDDFVIEKLSVDNKEYHFKYIENSFTQPNPKVNAQMITWVIEHVKDLGSDLLELYCGAGNFTIPLSNYFEKVLATEISKSSIKAALDNCELNSVSNISFVRMSAEDFTDAIDKVRPFRRMSHVDIDSYKLDTLFVDPPRSGIGKKGVEFASRFKNVVYVSCNPNTLYEDLSMFDKDYVVENMAIFDQFAYTNHLEMGVILKRRS